MYIVFFNANVYFYLYLIFTKLYLNMYMMYLMGGVIKQSVCLSLSLRFVKMCCNI